MIQPIDHGKLANQLQVIIIQVVNIKFILTDNKQELKDYNCR